MRAAPMRPASKHGQAFFVLLGSGLVVEAAAAWLAYTWAARVLPCRFSPAETLFGRSRVCPVPIALLGHNSLVPALLLGALVVVSAALFTVNLVGTVIATSRARRACAERRLYGPAQLDALPNTLRDVGCVVVIADDVLTAYCIGLLRPSVVVSSGLVRQLGAPELRAVVAHEASHYRHRDPLRAAVARSLARALFFVPALRDLAEATLAENEIYADALAIASVDRAHLAAALVALLGQPAPPGSATMATEPLLRYRLEALESGRRPAVHVPLARLALSAVLVTALLATGAWLPHYRRSRIVRSMPAVTQAAPPGNDFAL
jgi:Zn-dependent protease with chaperone function